jgi:Helix-turn-helix domain
MSTILVEEQVPGTRGPQQAGRQVRQPRLSISQTAHLVALYQAGLSQKDIAARLDRSPSAIWHCLRRAGLVGRNSESSANWRVVLGRCHCECFDTRRSAATAVCLTFWLRTNPLGERRNMNDIDEFLLVTLGLFFGITVLMLVLTYLERTLSEPARAPMRSVSGRQRTEDSVHQ